ncbi:tRNA dihydrouridine(20/20a) synthase DusA [Haliangium sp.]|uniref:tRNA dihydrouridine(20/20a) synthase DusA n=1 Tax=Haliangium sp. TaxID=2663208 RepID=UPI003D09918F
MATAYYDVGPSRRGLDACAPAANSARVPTLHRHDRPLPVAPSLRRGLTPPLSVAPMMDCTDRHYRYLMRQITRRTLLYTEMIPATTIIHGDRARFLDFDPIDHPVAIQLGGDDPAALAECARIAEGWGYDEINLNVGCPSTRVSSGNFGACLMQRPAVVARAVEAMRAAVSIPVTVKHRIGVDDHDRYEDMLTFVHTVAEAGTDRFTVHARKAWLKGLSPKQNRSVPPLRYGDVHRLKRELPHLDIEINGGFVDFDSVDEQLAHVDAVMIGRAAYDNPWLFADADRRYFGLDWAPQSRRAVVEAMIPYVAEQRAQGLRPHHVTRHMMHLYAGMRGARAWRRHLAERGQEPGVGAEVLREALELVPADA